MPEKDTPTNPWFMERRYFSLVIVLVFVILAIVAFNICYRHHAINTEQVLKEDRSTANLLSLLLDEHLKKIISIMESYGNRPLLLQAVRNKNAQKAVVHLINLKKSTPDVDILVITDRQGTLWAAYPERPELLGNNLAYRDWYKGVSKEWKPDITDLVLRIVREKDLAVTMSVPIFDEKGEVIGILVNTQRTVGLSYLFKQAHLDPGQDITVTDRKGQIVYSSRQDIEIEIRPYPFYPGIKKAMAANNKTFAVDDPDSGGRTRYISFAPVTNIGWTVSVERDKRSILLPGFAYYVQVTAIAFLLFLLITIFLLYSRRQVVAQELLESLQAKEALRKSEAQLLAILDATPFPIALVDVQDNKIDFWSQSALTLFGHTAPTAAEWYEIAYPDPNYRREVIERWKPFLEIARESGKPVNTGEYRVTCSDGSVRICELYATFLADRLIVTFNDITDRKQAEEALSSSKEFLNSVIEQSPESLWVSDSEGTMIRMNLVCHELFRVTEEEAVGKYNLFKDNLIEEQGFMPLVEDVFRKGEIARFTIDYDLSRVEHIKVSGGKHRIIDVIISPIKDLSGKLTNAIILHKDVTERKRAEEELRQQTEELRASNDELELFNRAATGRELRMIELKQEINELCHRLGEPPRHAMDPLETDSVAGAGPTPAEPGGGGA